MSQLKPSYMKKLFERLKLSRFSLHDFEVEFPEKGTSLAIIKFNHNENYKFIISEETITNYMEKTNQFSSLLGEVRKEKVSYTGYFVRTSPGDYKINEKAEVSDLDEALNKIQKWCDNIHDDICTSLEIDDEYQNLRENIEKIIYENIENENEPFSKKEIETLNNKLDELYTKFEELKDRNNITEYELSKLKEQLSEAKNSAKSYPKGIWARVTSNKLIQMITDFAKTKEGRELIIEGIKNFFPQ